MALRLSPQYRLQVFDDLENGSPVQQVATEAVMRFTGNAPLERLVSRYNVYSVRDEWTTARNTRFLCRVFKLPTERESPVHGLEPDEMGPRFHSIAGDGRGLAFPTVPRQDKPLSKAERKALLTKVALELREDLPSHYEVIDRTNSVLRYKKWANLAAVGLTVAAGYRIAKLPLLAVGAGVAWLTTSTLFEFVALRSNGYTPHDVLASTATVLAARRLKLHARGVIAQRPANNDPDEVLEKAYADRRREQSKRQRARDFLYTPRSQRVAALHEGLAKMGAGDLVGPEMLALLPSAADLDPDERVDPEQLLGMLKALEPMLQEARDNLRDKKLPDPESLSVHRVKELLEKDGVKNRHVMLATRAEIESMLYHLNRIGAVSDDFVRSALSWLAAKEEQTLPPPHTEERKVLNCPEWLKPLLPYMRRGHSKPREVLLEQTVSPTADADERDIRERLDKLMTTANTERERLLIMRDKNGIIWEDFLNPKGQPTCSEEIEEAYERLRRGDKTGGITTWPPTINRPLTPEERAEIARELTFDNIVKRVEEEIGMSLTEQQRLELSGAIGDFPPTTDEEVREKTALNDEELRELSRWFSNVASVLKAEEAKKARESA